MFCLINQLARLRPVLVDKSCIARHGKFGMHSCFVVYFVHARSKNACLKGGMETYMCMGDMQRQIKGRENLPCCKTSSAGDLQAPPTIGTA